MKQQKPQNKPPANNKQGGFGYFKNMITNSLFHFEGYWKKPQSLPINIFGASYDTKEGTEEFQKIMWFTYRKNFPGLAGSQYSSDTGWGCMIRVGQMLLAQALKRHANIEEREDLLSIITSFLDDDENKKSYFNYSIQKLSKVAQKSYNLEPGKWLTVSNISFILQELHHKSPLRGYELLRIEIFNNGVMFYQDAFKALGYQLCACMPQNFYCKECHKEKTDKSLLIVMIVRLGAESPSLEYKPMLYEMMHLPHFSGMLGGKPSKALFFVGTQGDQLIYLDPHFVQDSTNRKNLGENMETYFCNSFRTIPYSDIDPSLGLTMYIDDLEDLKDFSERVKVIEQKYKSDFFMFIDMKSQMGNWGLESESSRMRDKTKSFQYSTTFEI